VILLHTQYLSSVDGRAASVKVCLCQDEPDFPEPLGNTWTSPKSVSSLSNTLRPQNHLRPQQTADRPRLETLFRFRLQSRLGVDSSLSHSLARSCESYRSPTLSRSLLPCISVSPPLLFFSPTTFLIPALNHWESPDYRHADFLSQRIKRERHKAGRKVYKKLAA